VGLRGVTSGSITIAGIPGGATVSAAYLYYSFLDNGESASLDDIVINGTAKVGTKVGSGPDTCWGRTDSHTYRADVTAQVTGNGTYSLTGVASGGNILAQGASLVVVYKEASLPLRDVVIYNGNDVLSVPGSTLPTNMSGFDALGGAGSAKTTYIIGDGQPGGGFEEAVRFNGVGGGLSFPNSMIGSDGTHWDTNTHDVSASLPAGSVAARLALAQPAAGGDCLQWSAQVISVRSPTLAPGNDGPGAVLATGVGALDSPAPASPNLNDVTGFAGVSHPADVVAADTDSAKLETGDFEVHPKIATTNIQGVSDGLEVATDLVLSDLF
jgi:hypothetical protein